MKYLPWLECYCLLSLVSLVSTPLCSLVSRWNLRTRLQIKSLITCWLTDTHLDQAHELHGMYWYGYQEGIGRCNELKCVSETAILWHRLEYCKFAICLPQSHSYSTAHVCNKHVQYSCILYCHKMRYTKDI